MAPVFISWLDPPSGRSWLDIGCGTRALSVAIEQCCNPRYLSAIDHSPNFIEKVLKRISTNGDYKAGNAENIPFENVQFDLIVSGLPLNFFPDLETAWAEMQRVANLMESSLLMSGIMLSAWTSSGISGMPSIK